MKWFVGFLLMLSLGICSNSYAEVDGGSDSVKPIIDNSNKNDEGQPKSDGSMRKPISGFPSDIWTFGLEEDGILGFGTDDKYTMGISIAHLFRIAPEEESYFFSKFMSIEYKFDNFIPCWLDYDWCNNDHDDLGTHAQFYWWRLGGTGFTPTNITYPGPIYDDRPFAALFFWSAGYMRDHNGVFSNRKKVELQVGLLGTPIGYWVQSGIHSVLAPDRMPQGWPHQIGNGGSPTFLFQEDWIMDFDLAEKSKYIGTNLSYGYALGYWAKVNTGLSIQLGSKADREAQVGTLPNLPQVLSSKAAPDGSETPSAVTKNGNAHSVREKPTGFSLWLNFDFSAFAYNEMLRGAWTGQNDVTLDPSQINPYIFQGTIGADLSFIPKFIFCMNPEKHRLFVSYSVRSSEITTIHQSSHSWVGIYISSLY